NDNLKNGRVVVSNTDFGEEFFFDANEMEKIYVSLGENIQPYADNFIEYLKKRLLAYV
ncbi:SMI1/KNR4 family protein, partial [Enterobacter hormaechei]|nr:SMI1/KNR4 family protein [Enterobacter hormaechei]